MLPLDCLQCSMLSGHALMAVLGPYRTSANLWLVRTFRTGQLNALSTSWGVLLPTTVGPGSEPLLKVQALWTSMEFSRMATPTSQFSNLRLEDYSEESDLNDMHFEETTLEERKIIVQDIIASFDTRHFPSELFDPVQVSGITEEQARSPSSVWTINGDLQATLMHWCCHDEAGWTFLTRLNNPKTRALLFLQKVQRRLREQFDAYDELVATGPHELPVQLEDLVLQICRQVVAIMQEVGVDITIRVRSQYNAGRILLETLRGVCERDDVIPTTRPVPTLYRGILGGVGPNFMLESLERVQEKWPWSLSTREAQTALRQVEELLQENGAPDEYLARFQALLST